MRGWARRRGAERRAPAGGYLSGAGPILVGDARIRGHPAKAAGQPGGHRRARRGRGAAAKERAADAATSRRPRPDRGWRRDQSRFQGGRVDHGDPSLMTTSQTLRLDGGSMRAPAIAPDMADKLADRGRQRSARQVSHPAPARAARKSSARRSSGCRKRNKELAPEYARRLADRRNLPPRRDRPRISCSAASSTARSSPTSRSSITTSIARSSRCCRRA